MSKTNVYILRLEGGNYYVGKSGDVMNRFQQHLDGKGSAWTKKHKPMALVKSHENVSAFEEDKITKEYMSKYGIDKVRGGSYVEVELSDFQKEALNVELWAAKDLCTQCGRPGHFVKDCYATTDASGNKIAYEISKPKQGPTVKQAPPVRYGKAKVVESDDEDDEDMWGCSYCDRTFTTAFGCGVHEKSCKEKRTKTSKSKPSAGTCYRCGRSGHWSPDCYASSHVNGDYLD
jgi:predicted GIY-YIG superfamily endonuclease